MSMDEFFLTPILFVVFNRPDKTRQVFEQIRAIKPKYLYVSADGPRQNKEDEISKCDEVRSIVKNIDWDCDVKFLFREKNVGCSPALVSSIDWLFQNEDFGIILEDDCLPHLTFFPYCSELLLKYKDNKNIMMISGSNLGFTSGDSSYFFSKYGQIWGWATWKESWKKFERQIKIDDKDLKFNSRREQRYWNNNFSKVIWDVQWAVYSIWKNKGIAILPNVNLISNIGFGSDATNYTDENNINAEIKTNSINFPMNHPNRIETDIELDNRIFIKSYFVPLHKKIISSLLSRFFN
jgi:hypothetical protein